MIRKNVQRLPGKKSCANNNQGAMAIRPEVITPDVPDVSGGTLESVDSIADSAPVGRKKRRELRLAGMPKRHYTFRRLT